MSRTFLTFQHDAHLHTLQSTVIAIHPFLSLDEPNRQLFKNASDNHYIIVMDRTIFHPQGGGQPSDTGTIQRLSDSTTFIVTAVRMDVVHNGQVLHLGFFHENSTPIFNEGETVQQAIDVDSRLFYSSLHTAGHVLGSAVRHLLQSEVPNFDELKASHFPESASCEFQGLIDGKWKEPIQKRVDEYVASKMPVQVEWWDEDDFRTRGLERLIPDRSLVAAGEKSRVVNILGCEVYPCGGTHVDTTDLCGTVAVKKIARKAGNSKVSYGVVS